jgi:hypothetical protein
MAFVFFYAGNGRKQPYITILYCMGFNFKSLTEIKDLAKGNEGMTGM